MRILHVITRSALGGAQVHILDLMRGFAGDMQFGLITGQPGYLADEAASEGAEVFIVPQMLRRPAPYLDVVATAKMTGIIRAFRPGLVHCHTSKAGLLGRLAAKLAGVPSIYTAHGWRFGPGTDLTEKLIAYPGELLGARLGKAIIAVSGADVELGWRFRIAARRDLYLVHNGIPDSPRRATPGSTEEIVLVMVARFMGQKDHISALRSVVGLPSNVKLRFVGDGVTMARAKAEVSILGLGSRVEFCGDRTDVSEILAASHVFVLASRYEGLPISILEALRAGLPVVASDVGGVSDCVRHGYNGFIVPRGDVDALRNSLMRLVESPPLRVSMGAAGRRLYEEQFTIDKMLAKTLSVYRHIYARLEDIHEPASRLKLSNDSAGEAAEKLVSQ